jgi:DNA recombination protein RmuC
MSEIAIWLSVVFSAGALIFLLILLRRAAGTESKLLEKVLREEFRLNRDEASKAARELREEMASGQKTTTETMVTTLGEMGKAQKDQLENVGKRIKELTDSNETHLVKLRETVESQLRHLQESNEKKLDKMRETVDEKLQSTLEKRLGESFKIVSENLEAVQRGLGEMQNLATGVGDLKRVLTNVKARGTWGEVQLGALLEQILTPDQYDRNVQTSEESREMVEYAIRLPGKDDEPDSCVWLPIDAKFPQEDYLRLVEASDTADPGEVKRASASLLRTLGVSARDIHDKYLNPPRTTDFAIMFLPTEGLYAEVLRQPGQVEELQRKYRVVVAGPTTLSALLTSLQMGFRTLAIEKRSSEVWKVLGAVKTEFGKFGDVLDRVKSQLATASKTIDNTGVRTRAMERRLRSVEQLPSDQAEDLLGLPSPETSQETEEEDN